MKLKELTPLLAASRLIGDGEVELTGITTNSKRIEPGDLFICLPGSVHDGHRFAEDAVRSGAAALVVERPLDVTVPQLVVKSSRLAMAIIGPKWFGYPSRELGVIGVTGTNGKTTTTYIIEKLLADAGHRTGLMGTIQLKIGDETLPTANTTLEALEIQRNLRRMKEAQADYCVMEVSSHALHMGRVKGVRFRTALFTNLTQDHLDYHKTMDDYRAAKGLFFSRLGNEYADDERELSYAVLNADDPASAYFAELTAAQVLTYGIEQEADVRASDIRIMPSGTTFRLTTFRGDTEIKLKLIGKFNVYNALGAITAALLEGIDLAAIKQSLENMNVVPGRMEAVDAGQDFLVLVDYAHTPDGLENALSTIREFAEGEIMTVFGCGGDRDRTKRPIMGRIAAQNSHYVYVTSDNPRSEDPEAILRDIEPGVKEAGYGPDRYAMLADRREAIRQAVGRARKGDVILIAGKGHETYQIIQGTTHHFDDREEARDALRGRNDD
ncbi:UDP-N-acetylmuramoyl-L-alanyl-D-glutamate--2,6-diaminopimelate ligase [Paenibacillus sp. J31TS4]|uniref:UDP-N-acetylmuramoyl-L-alanyl-D-glutamate--2, 6-diaminopimelate ligase n=1 Tax=Paenibacillus sp. J31TS4 TaxID=2807195 RepID=UPI001B161D46|nr:UDP-N-acetylmuramoyl-L-alanyl-D-glutamate--2,6-diaminopimelate ligase [Paenibacillus sp. J31TS4]GIP39674.1 UDP-N-acetylmuramoyl-L-alanyl-D-glutamate--2,6-diaminopimelate ligase [Paenibacillus sp. J31TS4]